MPLSGPAARFVPEGEILEDTSGSRSSNEQTSVRPATAQAVRASISTPVRSTISVTAVISIRCVDTSTSTDTWSTRMEWQSGMREDVCLAPWMPATRAASTGSIPLPDVAECRDGVDRGDDGTARHGHSACQRLGGDVDHAGAALLVEVGQGLPRPGSRRPAGRSRAAPRHRRYHCDLVVVADGGVGALPPRR